MKKATGVQANNLNVKSKAKSVYHRLSLIIAVFAASLPLYINNALADTVELKIIDSIEIIAENVYDLDDPRYDSFIFKIANKMHIVTKQSVIRRELLLDKGDIFDTSLVNETVRNLRQLPYLLKTEIYLVKGEKDENLMIVRTSDKWTTVGGMSLHRSGGRSDIQIGIEESNLFGYGIYSSHDYFVLEDDRNYYQGEIRDSRFMGLNYSAGLFYSDNPRNGQMEISINKPLYHLRQNWGWGLNLNVFRQRFDYYIAEILAGRDRIIGKRLKTNSVLRYGPGTLKCSLYLGYTFTDLEPKQRFITSNSIYSNGDRLDSADILQLLPKKPDDTLSHTLEFGFRLQHVNFKSYNRINRFQKAEDVNLGIDILTMGYLAYDANLKRSLYQRINIWPQVTIGFENGYIRLGTDINIWHSDNGWIRRYVKHYFKWYVKYHNNHTFAININSAFNYFQNNSLTLYLDEDRGLRGYPVFFLNGDSRLIANIENRIFSDLEILSVGLGGVIFADIGNIWTRETSFSFRESLLSLGCGMRFGFSRSTQAEIVRVDLAYAVERKSWQISIGTGQYF
ncbi:MAG: hypothetical protein ABIE07_13025 [Candidatus Zixiibacteriota bacterium]